jgi:hypothetical protein
MHATRHDLIHYFILVMGLFVFATTFVLFKYQPATQLYIAFFGSVFYAAWGMTHHYTEGRLTRKIALEYVLLALLVFVLITAVLII